MKVKDIVFGLELNVLSGDSSLERDVRGAYVSDLLSDVMGNAKEGQIWLTIQTHKNVAAIASLKDLAAILLIKNTKPDADMLAQAQEEGIPVLQTNLPCFEAAGSIYEMIS